MVDVDLVNKILGSLQEGLNRLKSKQNVSIRDYQKDKDLQAIVERKLETSIQACIDIGNHIISHDELGIPNNYGEIFNILAQHGVIPDNVAGVMAKMAGFRNVLIHEYREIIIERVHNILQTGLGDFYAFAQHIIKYLEKKSSSV